MPSSRFGSNAGTASFCIARRALGVGRCCRRERQGDGPGATPAQEDLSQLAHSSHQPPLGSPPMSHEGQGRPAQAEFRRAARFQLAAAVSFGKRKSPAEPEPSSGASRTGNLCLQRFWKPLPRPLDPITQGASGEFRSAVFGRGTSIKPVSAASKRLCCRQPLVRAPLSRAVRAVPRQAHPAVGRHALRVVRCCGSMCDAIMGG